MIRVLNIIESISLGGAARTVFGTSKYSAQLGPFKHSLVSLAPQLDDPAACLIATECGIELLRPANYSELLRLVADHDIVLVQWWNNPEVDNLLRTQLPPCRLAAWIHIGGHHDPQGIPDALIPLLDFAIAGSPYTYESAAFASLSDGARSAKTAMVYDATDFARLADVRKVPHEGFNIGYIGTVDFSKMHPNYVRMSAGARIPGARFIVCGPGGEQDTIRAQAAQLGRADSFDVRGMVQDIAPVLSALDAYGYPLCEENYAAAELNLQEVMFCGIPPVVFPYGGVKHLVVDNFTGYIVRTEQEYAQALEHLFNSPYDRARIGRNAAEYARQIFGAEHAARKLNPLLESIMRGEKRSRAPFGSVSSVASPAGTPGAARFLESLRDSREPFNATLQGGDLPSLFGADARIMAASTLLKRGGVKNYRRFHSTDPSLCFWSGLASLGEGKAMEALAEFVEALRNNFPHWRPWWYVAQLSHQLGHYELARQSVAQVRALAPDFKGAQELQVALESCA